MYTNIFDEIRSWLTSFNRKIKAKKLGIPFRKREWYNYRAMLSKEELPEYSFIEIFNENGRYIDCPPIGGTVIYNIKGKKYLYRVVDFKNESRNRDWLYDTDYINPIIEFVEEIKED